MRETIRARQCIVCEKIGLCAQLRHLECVRITCSWIKSLNPMISTYLRAISAALFLVAAAAGQPAFDSSANSSLKGDYFVREVLLTGGASGSITAAASVTGTATFDGHGNYTFTGQGASLAGGSFPSVTLSGTYSVAANGFLEISSPAQTFLDPTSTDEDFGGISAVGPSAFVASATEQTNVTMLVAIPAGTSVTNGAFKGAYVAGSIDYPNASITDVREGSFTLNADGAGNVGTVAVSGSGALLQGGAALNQTNFLVTYNLAGEGKGTINFGAAANSQLVSGTKVFYISADGNIILGGSATGYDMIVGIKALPAGTGTNATANGEYFMAALEDQVDTTGEFTNLVDGYYGSVNTTGTGTAFFHNRFQSLQFLVYDYTLDSTLFNISPSGNIPFGGDTPYSYTFGDNGQAYIAVGDTSATVSTNANYSLTLGLAMQKFSGSGVYLSPNGIVNSASFAPITNPIAPNELITLFGNFGSGLGTAIPATSLPLPTKLGPVSVTINGVLAPLDYVSATQIIAQVPSSVSPNNNQYYAVVQVTNNNVASNSVTVYTSNTAPGVFANPVATGAAAAQHGNYTLVSAANPAVANETIIIYTGGLGAVTPPIVPDGGPAIAFPPGNIVNDPNVSVDFTYTYSNNLSFVGQTPTTAGLYQIDAVVPPGLATLNFLDVGTTDGYTSMTTISVAASGSARAEAVKAHRMARNRARPKKTELKARGR
jgi:uncharacterized protein (TIGR03437 family)